MNLNRFTPNVLKNLLDNINNFDAVINQYILL